MREYDPLEYTKPCERCGDFFVDVATEYAELKGICIPCLDQQGAFTSQLTGQQLKRPSSFKTAGFLTQLFFLIRFIGRFESLKVLCACLFRAIVIGCLALSIPYALHVLSAALGIEPKISRLIDLALVVLSAALTFSVGIDSLKSYLSGLTKLPRRPQSIYDRIKRFLRDFSLVVIIAALITLNFNLAIWLNLTDPYRGLALATGLFFYAFFSYAFWHTTIFAVLIPELVNYEDFNLMRFLFNWLYYIPPNLITIVSLNFVYILLAALITDISPFFAVLTIPFIVSHVLYHLMLMSTRQVDRPDAQVYLEDKLSWRETTLAAARVNRLLATVDFEAILENLSNQNQNSQSNNSTS